MKIRAENKTRFIVAISSIALFFILLPFANFGIASDNGNADSGSDLQEVSVTLNSDYCEDTYIAISDFTYGPPPYDGEKTNYGNKNRIFIGNNLANNPKRRRRALIKFDISDIPTNAKISSAELGLYKDGEYYRGEEGTYSIFPLREEWKENTITWNNAPNADTTPTDRIYRCWRDLEYLGLCRHYNTDKGSWGVIEEPCRDATYWYHEYNKWRLTSDVQQFVKKEETNYGWMIKGGDVASFPSSEYSNSDKRPYLEVTYTPRPIIKEVYYNVADNRGNRDTNQWVKLYNPSDQEMDISGWELCDNNKCDKLSSPDSAVISSNQDLVISANKDTWGNWDNFNNKNKLTLSNTDKIGDGLDNSDALTLKNNSDEVVDDISWGNEEELTASEGYSLKKVNGDNLEKVDLKKPKISNVVVNGDSDTSLDSLDIESSAKSWNELKGKKNSQKRKLWNQKSKKEKIEVAAQNETTSFPLELETSEDATCKYANSDAEYNADSMERFSNTDSYSKHHSTELDHLLDGEEYTYYIKCKDKAGNVSKKEKVSFSISVPEWRKDIQPGDILYDVDSTVGRGEGRIDVVAGHIGMYVGTFSYNADGDRETHYQRTVEANQNKPYDVWHQYIGSWDARDNVVLLRLTSNSDSSNVPLLVVTNTDQGFSWKSASNNDSGASNSDEENLEEIKQSAIEFALDQLEENYEFQGKAGVLDFITKSSDSDSEQWYCSELVWAAYKHQGIELDPPNTSEKIDKIPGLGIKERLFLKGIYYVLDKAITPHEVYLSAKNKGEVKYLEDKEILKDIKNNLFIIAFSPVDLKITDPEGNVIGENSDEIPNAVYLEEDINDDGHTEDLVYIPQRKKGDYSVEVEKEEGASGNYDLIAGNLSSEEGEIVELAEETSVDEVSEKKYKISSNDDAITLTDTSSEEETDSNTDDTSNADDTDDTDDADAENGDDEPEDTDGDPSEESEESEETDEKEDTPEDDKDDSSQSQSEEEDKESQDDTSDQSSETPSNLWEYYKTKDKEFPSIYERAELYERYGLGGASYYWGSHYQNMLLLNKLLSEAEPSSTKEEDSDSDDKSQEEEKEQQQQEEEGEEGEEKTKETSTEDKQEAEDKQTKDTPSKEEASDKKKEARKETQSNPLASLNEIPLESKLLFLLSLASIFIIMVLKATKIK